jgi:crotonobetainyl-CoA:carnitine CoA-transferase CaiB-like acyl-CoA transferase
MLAHQALAYLWKTLEEDSSDLDMITLTGTEPALPSSFMVGTMAQATIAAVGLAAAAVWRERTGQRQSVHVDMRHAALEYQSERHVILNGRKKSWPIDPLVGIYQCKDGNWVRPHLGFSHHRSGFLHLVGCPENTTDIEILRNAILNWNSFELEDAAAACGLPVTARRTFAEWDASPQGKGVAIQPLIRLEKIGECPPIPLHPLGKRPLDGIRCLDLTRIIAGPVCGRTLAAHGADVLSVTAKHLPFIASLIGDMNRGKRTCNIDLREEQDIFKDLLTRADILIQNYRPHSLEKRGFGPEQIAHMRPGIIYGDLSAYGTDGPWADRRGFDSLVQTASGFNAEEALAANATTPKELPCQCLDHSAGYLLAFGIMSALRKRAVEGGSWRVYVSLARSGLWLRSLGRQMSGFSPEHEFPSIPESLYETQRSGFGTMGYIRHAAELSRTPAYWELPSMPIGTHEAKWT